MAIKEAYDILTRTLSKHYFLFIVHFMQHAPEIPFHTHTHAHAHAHAIPILYGAHQIGQLLFCTKHSIFGLAF